LDQAGAEGWDHNQIVRRLREGYELSGWWQQMVAVTYEQARGLRDKHEQSDGYQVQRQRTICASSEVRIDWTDGRTRVLLGFRSAREGKCVVGAQHSKLPTREAAEEAKSDWAERLGSLRALLESDRTG
jgi:hypothetical protein